MSAEAKEGVLEWCLIVGRSGGRCLRNLWANGTALSSAAAEAVEAAVSAVVIAAV